jgi:hypothetical protein
MHCQEQWEELRKLRELMEMTVDVGQCYCVVISRSVILTSKGMAYHHCTKNNMHKSTKAIAHQFIFPVVL